MIREEILLELAAIIRNRAVRVGDEVRGLDLELIADDIENLGKRKIEERDKPSGPKGV